ncbi:transposase (plasmid) [Embleya sp. NBC_00888]|nr:transposase [Embleya sp. NBC_00888]
MGKSDGRRVRTKLRIGAALAREAKQAGVSFRAVAADCAYRDQDGFRCELADLVMPFVMALRPLGRVSGCDRSVGFVVNPVLVW